MIASLKTKIDTRKSSFLISNPSWNWSWKSIVILVLGAPGTCSPPNKKWTSRMLPLPLWEAGRGNQWHFFGRNFWSRTLEGENPSKYRGRFVSTGIHTKQLHILHRRFQPFFIYIHVSHVSLLVPVFTTVLPPGWLQTFFWLRKTVSNNTRPREREIISHQTGSSEHHGVKNAEMGWNMGQFPRRVSFNKNHDLHFDQQKKSWEPKRWWFFSNLKKPINLQKPPRQFTCSPPVGCPVDRS